MAIISQQASANAHQHTPDPWINGLNDKEVIWVARKNARQTSKKVASKKARFSATAVTARPRRVLLVQLFLRLNLETQKSSNLTVTDRLEAESSHLDDKIRTLANQIEELIAENQRLAQDQEQYLAKYTQLDANCLLYTSPSPRD